MQCLARHFVKVHQDLYTTGLITTVIKNSLNHGTQHALLKIIETWKTKLNMGHKVGVMNMDLSKVFDSLNHEWVIPKLKCYGIDQNAIEFFRSYLSNCYQCCKINNTLGDWRKIIAGVPQVSILGPLTFNIFLNDIFFFLKDANFGNYADDSTLYAFQRRDETRRW